MLKLSSIEICATSNVNRAWQIASQRLPFENGINSGIRKRLVPAPLAFCNEPSSKFVPFFLERVDEKLALFTLFSISFELHTNRNSSRLRFVRFTCISHSCRVFDVDVALFRKAMWSRIIFRNVEFPLSFYCFYCSLIFNRVLQWENF